MTPRKRWGEIKKSAICKNWNLLRWTGSGEQTKILKDLIWKKKILNNAKLNKLNFFERIEKKPGKKTPKKKKHFFKKMHSTLASKMNVGLRQQKKELWCAIQTDFWGGNTVDSKPSNSHRMMMINDKDKKQMNIKQKKTPEETYLTPPPKWAVVTW